MSAARAVKVKDLDNSTRGATRVLWLVGDGDVAHCVITSAVVAYDTGAPETYVFASDPDGNVTNWMDLPGSFRGDFDHDRAITGYVKALS